MFEKNSPKTMYHTLSRQNILYEHTFNFVYNNHACS